MAWNAKTTADVAGGPPAGLPASFLRPSAMCPRPRGPSRRLRRRSGTSASSAKEGVAEERWFTGRDGGGALAWGRGAARRNALAGPARPRDRRAADAPPTGYDRPAE